MANEMAGTYFDVAWREGMRLIDAVTDGSPGVSVFVTHMCDAGAWRGECGVLRCGEA